MAVSFAKFFVFNCLHGTGIFILHFSDNYVLNGQQVDDAAVDEYVLKTRQMKMECYITYHNMKRV